jgi:hypothetical protein
VHRQIEVGRPCRIDTEEIRRCDPNHGEGHVADSNRPARRRRWSSEIPLTEIGADDGNRGCPRAIVTAFHHPSCDRRNPETAEVVTRNVLSDDPVGASFHHHIQGSSREITEDAGEHRVRLFEQLEGRVGEDAAGQAGLVVVGPAAHRVHDKRTPRLAGDARVFGAPVQDRQRFRILDRQRPEQDRIHEAVDRGVRTDAERQREHGKAGERPVVQHRAHGVPHILPELFEPGKRPDGAHVFLHQRQISQIAARGAFRFVPGQPVRFGSIGFFLEVKLQLFADLLFLTAARDPPTQFVKERIHRSLLIDAVQNQADRAAERLPFRVFADQLLPPEWSKTIVTGAFALVGELPRGGDPSLRLEAMERRVQRAGLDLQEVFRGPLDVPRDCMAMARARQQGSKDEEVERALQEFDPRRRFAGHCVDTLHHML